MGKEEREMRRRYRMGHPDIMSVIYTMTMLANEFGQDAHATIDRLHVLVAQKMGQMHAEIFYEDILGEMEVGYAIPDFWKVVKVLWMNHRVNRDLYNEARILEGKYKEAKLWADVDFAFDSMLKRCGPMVKINDFNPRGEVITAWVPCSTYEVN